MRMTAKTESNKQRVRRQGPEWERARKQALRRDQFRCQGCTAHPGKTHGVDLQVHHIVPVSDGGTNDLDNLLTLCNSCHWTVHRYEDEFDELDLTVLEQHESYSLSTFDYRKDVEELSEAAERVCKLLIDNGPMKLENIIEESGYSRGYVQQQLDTLKFGKFVCRVRRGVYAYIPSKEYRELSKRESDETGRISVSVWNPGKQVEITEFVDDPREVDDD